VTAGESSIAPRADGEGMDPGTSRDTRDEAVARPWLLQALERDQAEVRLYAASFVTILGRGGQTWENMAPLIRGSWAIRHDQFCVPRHDWRLAWSAARDGWREAGGAFDPLPPVVESPLVDLIVPARGARVYDAFGAPAGRVKEVRDGDFLLARPLARDVYVPFGAIIWPGTESLRIRVPNAQMSKMRWERPPLLPLRR
jgi:hypothetical protein